MISAQLILLIIFFCFFVIVFRGAPYVPTKKREIDDIFELHEFSTGERLVDLGSGDGKVILAAAHRGVKATGFELNPFLVIVSWWRLRRYKNVSVKMTDYWATHLPKDTRVVYVFLASPYMKKLDTYLEQETKRLGHDLLLISNGMKISGRAPHSKVSSLLAYEYKA